MGDLRSWRAGSRLHPARMLRRPRRAGDPRASGGDADAVCKESRESSEAGRSKGHRRNQESHVPRLKTMATKIVMEALSPTMEEGRLVKWLKNEGDAVKSGDVLAEVETDKAVMELVARGDGVLRKRIAAEGDAAPVGTLLGVIATADENIDALVGAPAPAAAGSASAPAQAAPAPTSPPQPAQPAPRREGADATDAVA